MREFRNVIEYKNMGENARGTLVYQIVRVPPAMVRTLGLGKTESCRIQGTLDGEAIALALNPDPESTQFLMVSKKLLKRIGKDVGDEVVVSFEVQDPNHVDVPEELEQKLRGKARDAWEELTAGKKRTWATFVGNAKLQATRTRRVKEVLVRLKTSQLDPKQPVK